ncbi:hypothetical protein [Brevibacillus invocatus]|uniref:hypothetical protein n=1 Tax=Brevibacillus invocatus TaxID=173959 RepID=UPI0016056EFA
MSVPNYLLMNGCVIAVGASIASLYEEAMKVADSIGTVHVDVGDTACKVPMATTYLEKIEGTGLVGRKRKTCIC